MSVNHRGLPEGSSAFERAMADINSAPVVEISCTDDVDEGPKVSKKGHQKGHHEEGMLVHGLHHCYKVDGGQCLTSFRCNHDHHRVSNGHLEEITHVHGASPTPIRRMSIASSGAHLLAPDDHFFRGRSNSDAVNRRSSVAISPGSQRRASTMGKGSNENLPRKSSMSISPKSQRRGSNVNLQSDNLHYVYDQFNSK